MGRSRSDGVRAARALAAKAVNSNLGRTPEGALDRI